MQGGDSRRAKSLSEVVNFLRGEAQLEPAAGQLAFTATKNDDDFSEVRGQQHLKRAVEVAAAGAWNPLRWKLLPGGKKRRGNLYQGSFEQPV